MATSNRHIGPLLALGAMLMSVAISAQSVQAASSDPETTIEPAISQINLPANTPSLPQKLTVRNNSSLPITYRLAARDFGSLDESGGVLFYQDLDANRQYGLANWIKLDTTSVTVPAHSKKLVPFTILNDAKVSPGGHYGAILVQKNTTSGLDASVSTKQALASLLFVRKIGGEQYGISLDGTEIVSRLKDIPTKVRLTFGSTGNVHIVPRGTVNLYDSKNKSIATGVVNVESGIILPGEKRRIAVPLTVFNDHPRPGRYKLDIKYRYDGREAFDEFTKTFWVSPIAYFVRWAIMLGLIVVLITAIWFILRHFGIFSRKYKYLRRK